MTDSKLKSLIDNSAATDDFKQAIHIFTEGLETDLLTYSKGAPRIKVLRVIMKLLETFPSEAISHLDVQAVSSCSGFEGHLTFGPARTKVKFNWDCRWKAEQEDMMAWYGMPDQTKAAQIFGYQCFKTFEAVASK